MAWRNTQSYWGRTARLLHWVIALFIFAAMGTGFIILNLNVDTEEGRVIWRVLMPLHKDFGVVGFVLSVARVLWAVTNVFPRAPAALTALEKFSAKVAHYLLYALILIVPLSGWASSSAFGVQTRVFEAIPLPKILEKDEALMAILDPMHRYLAYAITAIIAAHTLAACWHHFIKRDDVLTRIIRG